MIFSSTFKKTHQIDAGLSERAVRLLNNKQSKLFVGVEESLGWFWSWWCHVHVTEFVVPKIDSVTLIRSAGSSDTAGLSVYRQTGHVFSSTDSPSS